MPDPSPKLILDLLAHAHAFAEVELGQAEITVTLSGGTEFTGVVAVAEETRDVLVLREGTVRHVMILSQVVAVSVG